MIHLKDFVSFGISPSMLFPDSFDDELTHFEAMNLCCRLPEYERFETFLPKDKGLRRREIQLMKACSKGLNYNIPGYFQTDASINPTNPDPKIQAAALTAMKEQIDFAAEADSPLIAMTGVADPGPKLREEYLQRFFQYFMQVCEYANQYHILVAVEPIERHRFKKLILGPTSECAEFIKKAQETGAANARLMMDFAHLPLMEETADEAMAASALTGLGLVHLGNAVLEPSSSFYGHTHPPIGVQNGMFDMDALTHHFSLLMKQGYISAYPKAGSRPFISFEVRPYPGADPITSAHLMYEKAVSAFRQAAAQLSFAQPLEMSAIEK